jgi:hypothetical protein
MAIFRVNTTSAAASSAATVVSSVDEDVEITPPVSTEDAAAAVADAEAALEAAIQSGDPNTISAAQAQLATAQANQTAANDMVNNATGETMLSAGQLVSLVDVGGSLKYVPTSCLESSYPTYFFGVVLEDAAQGQTVRVSTGRGSIVSPLVEGGVPLDPSKPVYLSLTPGRATQDLDSYPPGAIILKVGQAVTSTKMVLNNDYCAIDNYI